MDPWTRRYLLAVSAILGLLGWTVVLNLLLGQDEAIRSHGGTRWDYIKDDFPPWPVLAAVATAVFVVVLRRSPTSSASLTARLIARLRTTRMTRTVAYFGPLVLAVAAMALTFPLVGFVFSFLMPVGLGALGAIGCLLFVLKGWIRSERASVDGLSRAAALALRLSILTAAVYVPFGPLGLAFVVRFDDIWRIYAAGLAALALTAELAAFLVAAAARLESATPERDGGNEPGRSVAPGASAHAGALYGAAGPVGLAAVFWLDRFLVDHGWEPSVVLGIAAVLGLLLVTATTRAGEKRSAPTSS